MKTYFVYILSNKSRRMYVGFTSELQTRIFKHRNKWYEESFTARYTFDMLVYFEPILIQAKPSHVKKNQRLEAREEAAAGSCRESGLG